MQVARSVMLVPVMLIALSACDSQPQAAHTVDYYRANDQPRRAQFLACKSDPGSLGKTPDCVNVFEAERLEGIGSFKDLPPMQMPPPTPPSPDNP